MLRRIFNFFLSHKIALILVIVFILALLPVVKRIKSALAGPLEKYETVWVGVKEGEKVKAWQAIASLDRRELEKDLKKKLLAYMNEHGDFKTFMGQLCSQKAGLSWNCWKDSEVELYVFTAQVFEEE